MTGWPGHQAVTFSRPDLPAVFSLIAHHDRRGELQFGIDEQILRASLRPFLGRRTGREIRRIRAQLSPQATTKDPKLSRMHAEYHRKHR